MLPVIARAGRGRGAGQHRHHPRRGRRGRARRRRRARQRRLAAAWPTRTWPRVVADAGVPVGAHALARAQPRDARAGRATTTWSPTCAPSWPRGSTTRSPAGVAADQLVLDPGLGSPRRAEHNWALLRRPARAARPRPPGAGRRLPQVVPRPAARRPPTAPPRPADGRDAATVATSVLAAAAGAWGVRVHDVGADARRRRRPAPGRRPSAPRRRRPEPTG